MPSYLHDPDGRAPILDGSGLKPLTRAMGVVPSAAKTRDGLSRQPPESGAASANDALGPYARPYLSGSTSLGAKLQVKPSRLHA